MLPRTGVLILSQVVVLGFNFPPACYLTEDCRIQAPRKCNVHQTEEEEKRIIGKKLFSHTINYKPNTYYIVDYHIEKNLQ
jgi:hypothetical protein